jgi:hypothetical protein
MRTNPPNTPRLDLNIQALNERERLLRRAGFIDGLFWAMHEASYGNQSQELAEIAIKRVERLLERLTTDPEPFTAEWIETTCPFPLEALRRCKFCGGPCQRALAVGLLKPAPESEPGSCPHCGVAKSTAP